MGQEIVYCYWCSSRILGMDFEKGSAVVIGNHACCPRCLPAVLAGLPASQRETLLNELTKVQAARPAARNTPRGGLEIPPTRTPRAVPAIPPRSKSLAAVIAAVGVLVLVVLFLLQLPENRKEPERPEAPPKPGVPEPDRSAEDALLKARDAARSGVDIDLQIRLWEEAVARTQRTPLRDEAAREHAAALARRKEVYAQDLARMSDNVDTLVKDADFKKALDILTVARKRRDSPDWGPAIDRKIEEVRKAEAAGAPYRQGDDAGGLVCVEAERFHLKSDAGDHAWSPVAAPPGFSGTGAMAALPNKGGGFATKFEAISPRMDYRILFAKTGTYRVWVRAMADAGADDSLHVGLDGRGVPTASQLTFTARKTWVWSSRTLANSPPTIDIATPGVRTLNVWMREDGAVVDKIVLTLDAQYVPKDAGPPESPR